MELVDENRVFRQYLNLLPRNALDGNIHLVVASADSVFPKKMFPSKDNNVDVDAGNHISEADSALYMMDRGDMATKQKWVAGKLSLEFC